MEDNAIIAVKVLFFLNLKFIIHNTKLHSYIFNKKQIDYAFNSRTIHFYKYLTFLLLKFMLSI